MSTDQRAKSVARQEFYSIADIAQIMNVSRETARKQMINWRRQGMTVTFGERTFIRRTIFNDWTCAQDGFNMITGQRNFKVIRGERKTR